MATLAVISGVSIGWALLGAAAVALPVAAHLLSRRAGKAVEFPGMRFVREIVAASARRRRLRDAALLLLRIMVIVLVAAAFDRPVWSTPRADAATADGVDLVVVLDRSASMSRVHQGRELYERARDEALALLDGLDPERDRVAVIFAGFAPESALPELSANFGALRAAVAASASTFEGADTAGALALAATLPTPGAESDASDLRPRRVVVISDLQRSQWGELPGALPSPPGVEFSLLPVGPALPTPNLAIISASAAPARPLAGRPVAISVTIVNFGEAEARTLVTLDTGEAGQTPRQAAATIPPHGRASVSFAIDAPPLGHHILSASLPEDAFGADNEVSIPIEAVSARRVAIVTRAAIEDPSQSTRYLHAALDAIGPSEGAVFEPALVSPDSGAMGDLSSFDAVIVAGAGELGDATLRALARRIEAGAGAIWIVDSPESQQSILRLAGAGSLLASAASFTLLDRPQALAGGDFDSPALALFDGPAQRALLAATFRAVATAGIEGEAASQDASSSTLLTFESGEPFAAWRPLGRGRLLTLSADLAPRHSTLTTSALFPALLHELLGFVLPGETPQPPVYVGGSVALTLGAALDPPYFDDHGRAVVTTFDGAGAATLTAPPVSSPGVVTIRAGSGAPVGGVSVTIDPAESDFSALDPAEAAATLDRALLASDSTAPLSSRAATNPASLARSRTTELWPALIAPALALCALEALLAAPRPAPRRRKAGAP